MMELKKEKQLLIYTLILIKMLIQEIGVKPMDLVFKTDKITLDQINKIVVVWETRDIVILMKMVRGGHKKACFLT